MPERYTARQDVPPNDLFAQPPDNDHVVMRDTGMLERADRDARKDARNRALYGEELPVHQMAPEQRAAIESFQGVHQSFDRFTSDPKGWKLDVPALFDIVEAQKAFKAKDVASAINIIASSQFIPGKIRGELWGVLSKHEVDVAAVTAYERAKNASARGLARGYEQKIRSVRAAQANESVIPEAARGAVPEDPTVAFAIPEPSRREKAIAWWNKKGPGSWFGGEKEKRSNG